MTQRSSYAKLKRYVDAEDLICHDPGRIPLEDISGGNPFEERKLKLPRTSLQSKCSELQVLDHDIVEQLEDVSKIDSDVSESCELISVIQECMVDLESALTAQESREKSQQSNSLQSPKTAQGHLQTVHMHRKLPKLEMKKFHGNPIECYPFGESLESAVHKNSNLSRVEKFNYLKSLLTGITQSVVTGLTLTRANNEKSSRTTQRKIREPTGCDLKQHGGAHKNSQDRIYKRSYAASKFVQHS